MPEMIAALRYGLVAQAELVGEWLAAERGRFALWLPVFMGAGVLFYFSLRTEPPWWAGFALLIPASLGAWLAGPWLRPILLCLLACALGFASAQLATARALPIEPLPKKSVFITGTVRGVELLPEGRRVTLDHSQLGEAEAALARRLRIRLRNNDPAEIETGDLIRLRALVRAPSPPAYPGGWDLQRDAFFSGIAGYGFALGYAQLLEQAPPQGLAHWVQWLRDTIEARVMAAVPGPAGAVSATLLTGLTSGIPAADRDAFRDSGLAHLLAVAGLHVGIVMAFAMGAVRLALALSERAALFWPCRQVAALAALAAGAGYMLLTGVHLPILRSFAMASLFTLAMLAGRRAISLRGLGLAGVVIILLEPQELVGVSFQMSFSAVLALIAGYEALRGPLRAIRGDGGWHRRLVHHVAALAITSALAGTASAPFGAYHFGRIQLYYVLSNMVAVPLTALWVMPAGLVSIALIPFGLERFALVPMGWGAEGILWIARATAALPAATIQVPHAPAWGLAVLSVGLAWTGIWRSRIRLAGPVLILAGLGSPLLARPPDILVSDDARLIGFRTREGIYLQSVQGASKFTRDSWEQFWADADPIPFPASGLAAEGAVDCTDNDCLLRPRAGAAAALLLRPGSSSSARCGAADVVLSAEPVRAGCPGMDVVDRFTAWREGAQAIWLGPGEARILSDREDRGDRPWVPPPPQARREQPTGPDPAPAD